MTVRFTAIKTQLIDAPLRYQRPSQMVNRVQLLGSKLVLIEMDGHEVLVRT